jgi:sugar O-acyltransferase (sialic acid O-acetyltransferase NeuD family)
LDGEGFVKPVVIFGTGELGDLAYFYFAKKCGRPVAAFTVDAKALDRRELQGLPVLAFEELKGRFPPSTHAMFVAIGSSKMNKMRIAKYHEAKGLGYELATCVSPDAAVHAAQIGDNCLIMDYNNIHPYVRLGNNLIFSNSNHIGHHSVVEDHCFFSSNVVVGGGTTIGEGSFLGVNATLSDHITVGKYNLIGAGALILRDTQDGEVYAVPATQPRKVKSDRVGKF